ncbi:hypothetical protein ACWDUL_01845 [Nocardia niigatensis]
MTRIGITGHIHLTPETAGLIHEALITRLRPYGASLVGVSCLAPGADSIFADAVLAVGGRLDAVIPAHCYRNHALPTDNVATFDNLLNRATVVRVMPYIEPSTAAYRAANAAVLADVERLLAVWDGSDGGPGSTADAVATASHRAIPVDIVWPEGAKRTVGM